LGKIEETSIRNIHIYQLVKLLLSAGFDLNNIKPATITYNWCIFIRRHLCSTVMHKNNKVVFGFSRNGFNARPNLRPLRKLFPHHKLKTIATPANGDGSGYLFSLEAIFKDTEPVECILDTLSALTYLNSMV